jgi:hypothetical protein
MKECWILVSAGSVARGVFQLCVHIHGWDCFQVEQPVGTGKRPEIAIFDVTNRMIQARVVVDMIIVFSGPAVLSSR